MALSRRRLMGWLAWVVDLRKCWTARRTLAELRVGDDARPVWVHHEFGQLRAFALEVAGFTEHRDIEDLVTDGHAEVIVAMAVMAASKVQKGRFWIGKSVEGSLADSTQEVRAGSWVSLVVGGVGWSCGGGYVRSSRSSPGGRSRGSRGVSPPRLCEQTPGKRPTLPFFFFPRPEGRMIGFVTLSSQKGE